MTDDPSLFRVIEGDSGQADYRKPRKERTPSGKTVTTTRHICSHCDSGDLVKVLRDAYFENGILKRGLLFWVCRLCGRPYAFIGSIGEAEPGGDA